MVEGSFQNLNKLKTVQAELKVVLGKKYVDTIQPFIDIITKVMQSNKMNEFEALKLIKEETSIYKTEHAPMFFSAALLEITESKHFGNLKE